MNLELFNLSGKVAWVTGGSKGLGLAMAHALAGAGADVVINSRHRVEAEAAAGEIAAKHGRRALGIEADVTRPDQVAEVVSRAMKQFGSVDILVNNAGINIRKPTIEMSLDEWREVVDVNLTAPFICTQAVVPHMIHRGWGRIIYMSSMLGQVGLAGRPPYTATKGALILLAKTQALEFAGKGITVNAICPGPFGTPMNQSLMDDPEKYKAFVSKIPLGRWGELHELDGTVLLLASNASSFITGTTITVDGGWTAQ